MTSGGAGGQTGPIDDTPFDNTPFFTNDVEVREMPEPFEVPPNVLPKLTRLTARGVHYLLSFDIADAKNPETPTLQGQICAFGRDEGCGAAYLAQTTSGLYYLVGAVDEGTRADRLIEFFGVPLDLGSQGTSGVWLTGDINIDCRERDSMDCQDVTPRPAALTRIKTLTGDDGPSYFAGAYTLKINDTAAKQWRANQVYSIDVTTDGDAFVQTPRGTIAFLPRDLVVFTDKGIGWQLGKLAAEVKNLGTRVIPERLFGYLDPDVSKPMPLELYEDGDVLVDATSTPM
jgi:hypothetical protein